MEHSKPRTDYFPGPKSQPQESLAVNLSLRSPEAHFTAAQGAIELGAYDEGFEHASRAITAICASVPEGGVLGAPVATRQLYQRALGAVAVSLIGQAKFEQAIDSIEEALSVSTDDSLLSRSQQTYLKAKNVAALCGLNRGTEAIKLFKDLVRSVPTDRHNSELPHCAVADSAIMIAALCDTQGHRTLGSIAKMYALRLLEFRESRRTNTAAIGDNGMGSREHIVLRHLRYDLEQATKAIAESPQSPYIKN